jgi:hypothetical protein
LQDPEIVLASIPDLFVAVDGNTGIESEFHSTHAIPRHVPIDGGVFGSFIALGYPEVFLGESTRCIFVNYILDLRVRKYFRGEQLFV